MLDDSEAAYPDAARGSVGTGRVGSLRCDVAHLTVIVLVVVASPAAAGGPGCRRRG